MLLPFLINSMHYWVYLLQTSDGYLYTGYTADPVRRLANHRAGKGARFTRMKKDFELCGILRIKGSRSDAMSLEAKIKQLNPPQKRKLTRRVPLLAFAKRNGIKAFTFNAALIEDLVQSGKTKMPHCWNDLPEVNFSRLRRSDLNC